MAITPINNRYPGFIFDGENSRDYGVYITDVEVFGAPKRKVQMISIPGRNGDYALDEGSFENITVKYECALGAGTESDFNDGISDFRNWLASKVGYKTLSDEINTGEFRKAVFLDGMEVPTLNKKTGTFEIVFDCMPQRWLDDASSLPVEMASGDDIFNPTLFDASPLLSVWGYGDIHINDDVITIDDAVIGNVLLANSGSVSPVNFSEANLRTGDAITLNPSVIIASNIINDGSITNLSVVRTEGDNIVADVFAFLVSAREFRLNISVNDIAFTAGTDSTKLARVYVGFDFTQGGETVSPVVEYGLEVKYTSGKISVTAQCYPNQLVPTLEASMRYTIGNVAAYSTKSALGEPLYFDMEIGEAYKEEDGEIISVNNAVSFPAKLPTLKPGHNDITFDNTVDKLVITPRWWKV